MKFMGSSPAITSHRTTGPSFIHHLGLEAVSERQGDSPLLTWARLRRLGPAGPLGWVYLSYRYVTDMAYGMADI